MKRAKIEGIEALRRQEAGRTYLRDERRELIANQVDAFLAAGGIIKKVAQGVSGDRFSRGITSAQHVWGHKPYKAM